MKKRKKVLRTQRTSSFAWQHDPVRRRSAFTLCARTLFQRNQFTQPHCCLAEHGNAVAELLEVGVRQRGTRDS